MSSSHRQATEDFAARFLIEKEEIAANSARFLIEKEEIAANSAHAAAAEAERERTKHSEMLRIASEVRIHTSRTIHVLPKSILLVSNITAVECKCCYLILFYLILNPSP